MSDPVKQMVKDLLESRAAQVDALEATENILTGMHLLDGQTKYAGLDTERILKLITGE
jgi:hypothetical protein